MPLALFPVEFWEIKSPVMQSSSSGLYLCTLIHRLSRPACFAKKLCEDGLQTSETLFSAPQWFCTFWKRPHYYSVGDFKHFANNVWCSLMHSHAQRALSSRSAGCVSIIKALLTHMITGMAHWHMPPPLGSQTLARVGGCFPSIILWLEWVIQCFWSPSPPLPTLLSSSVYSALLLLCAHGSWISFQKSCLDVVKDN